MFVWLTLITPVCIIRIWRRWRSISASVPQLRFKRRALGLTQQQLANQLGISRASLANVETGRQRILVHQLYELADQLSVNVSDLLPGSTEAEALQTLDDLLFSENVTVQQRQQIATLLKN